LWAVVNNAGVAVPSGPCDWHTLDDYKFMLDVNLNGVIGVTLSVLPLIKKARGRVVNVASVFTLAPFGVKVLCIEPGFFKTNVTDSEIHIKNIQTLWDRLPQDVKEDYGVEYIHKCEYKSSISHFCHSIFHFYLLQLTLVSVLAKEVTKEKVSQMSDGDLMKVVSCMEHAVSAAWPRKRYSPGWDAKFFWLPLSYMPTCVVDYLFLKNAIPIAKKLQ
ncbi:hypothetical protein XENOCAPTIV_011648, partial [Xenoophorus captivus]